MVTELLPEDISLNKSSLRKRDEELRKKSSKQRLQIIFVKNDSQLHSPEEHYCGNAITAVSSANETQFSFRTSNSKSLT